MAASIGFFNPNISHTSNVLVVGSILASACVLQQVAQKTFEEKALQENEISSKHTSMIALSGSAGLAGLLAGADLRKSATLAVAALVLLAVVDYVSLHFNPESKTPRSPEGKRPASPTTPAKPTQPQTPVKEKSTKLNKTPGKTPSSPIEGTPPKPVLKGRGYGSPLPPQATPASSAPPRKKWPDPLVKTTPPKISPSEASPVQKSPELAHKENVQDTFEEEDGGPPPPAYFDVTLLDQSLLDRFHQFEQPPATPPDENALLVSRLTGMLSQDMDDLGEKEGVAVTAQVEDGESQTSSTLEAHTQQLIASLSLLSEDGFTIDGTQEEESLGDSRYDELIATALASSPPKKSQMEYIIEEIANSEQTFFDALADYKVNLIHLSSRQILSTAQFEHITEGLDTIIETSPLFLRSIQSVGAFKTYMNTEIMDTYFNALITLMENTESATTILLDAVARMDSVTRKIYGEIWVQASFPFQRATRHPLLLKQIVEYDISFEPLRKKFADCIERSNNRRLVEEFDSLILAIQELAKSNKHKLQIVDNFGTVTYQIIDRRKSLFNSKSTETGVVVEDSVKVLEHTLDFLIRLAKIATSQEPHPDLAKITKEQVIWYFQTLEQHAWYTKAEAGKKTLRMKASLNGVAPKADELKTILGLKKKSEIDP